MIFEKRDLKFQRLGFMIDCSRGAVPKIQTIEKFVDYLSVFGYTFLELYTEDTYEIEGEPYFGYMRGRYTKEEIRSLDSYCRQKGIELVPCIQTLAHLERIKKYKDYNGLFEVDNILTVGDDRVYSLIERMFLSLGKAYSTNRIHIGMDEAFMLGRGKLLDTNGYEDRSVLMRRHLQKVAEIARNYNFVCEMWSDMFTSQPVSNASPYDNALVPSIGKDIPENVVPVMWHYWKQEDEQLTDFIKINSALAKNCIFAGGAHKWEGFAPNNGYSIEVTKKQIEHCIKQGVSGYMLTGWGDGAADASLFSVLPTVFATAVFAHGKELNQQYISKFNSTVGCTYDAFMTLDRLNRPENKKYETLNNQSFIYFYSDILQGIADSIVQPDVKYLFTNVSEEIRKAKCGRDFKYLFASAKTFADFIAEKANLGKKAYEAYIAKENDGLKQVVKRIDNALKLLDRFIEEYAVRWHTENKSFGFEKQLVRFGGLKLRMEYTRDKIKQYVSGKIPVIEEFETPHLPIGWVCGDEGITCDNAVLNDFASLISGGSLL